MRPARLAGLGVVCWLVLSPAHAAAQVGPEDLARRAERAAALAEASRSAPTPERMAEVRARLGLPARVSMHGRVLRLPPDPVLARLRGGTRGDFAAAARHLRGIARWARAAGRTRPATGVARDVARASAAIPGAEVTVVQEVLRRIGDALARLFAGLDRTPLLGWLLLVLLAAGAAWGVTRLGRGVVPEAARSRAAAGIGSAGWRVRAERALASGDLAGALAAAYRALVAALGERGLVRDRPSLTAGEVRAVAADATADPAGLGDATRRYERVRYGGAAAREADVRALLDALRRVGR